MRYLFLILITLVAVGCGGGNYAPTESEVARFSEIRFHDERCNDYITFTWNGGYNESFLATEEQWLRIKHLRNTDWNDRKEIFYRLNHRDGRLVSFYKEED